MEKIDLIILAAGKSERFGSLKGFALYNGKPLLESAIQLHQNNFLGKTIVVFSQSSEQYRILLEKKYPKVIFIENKNPEFGPFSSLQLGISASDTNYFFILPVDCPCRDVETWKLLHQQVSEHKLCIKPSFKNKGGHPIIINLQLKKIIENSSSENNLKNILHNLNLNQIQYLEVADPLILKNINSTKDIS